MQCNAINNKPHSFWSPDAYQQTWLLLPWILLPFRSTCQCSGNKIKFTTKEKTTLQKDAVNL